MYGICSGTFPGITKRHPHAVVENLTLVAVMGLFVSVKRHVKCVANHRVRKAVNHAVSFVVEVPTKTLIKMITMTMTIIMKVMLMS